MPVGPSGLRRPGTPVEHEDRHECDNAQRLRKCRRSGLGKDRAEGKNFRLRAVRCTPGMHCASCIALAAQASNTSVTRPKSRPV